MKFIKNILKQIYLNFLKVFFPRVYQTRNTSASIKFRTVFFQKILGINRGAY